MWKSDNQGIKEVTFIQRGRRGGDVETQNGRSNTHVWWIKIRMDIAGWIPAQGSSSKKINPHNFWL